MAEFKIRRLYVGKMIPECYRQKSQASPFLNKKKDGAPVAEAAPAESPAAETLKAAALKKAEEAAIEAQAAVALAKAEADAKSAEEARLKAEAEAKTAPQTTEPSKQQGEKNRKALHELYL